MVAQNIAVLIHDFTTGGSERIALRLAREWSFLGRNVMIVCGSEKGALRDLAGARVSIRAVQPPTPRGLRGRAKFARAAARMLDDAELLFVPGNHYLPVLSQLPKGRWASVAKISNAMFRPDRTGLRGLANRIAIRRDVRRADALVAMSPALHEEAFAVTRHRNLVTIAQPTLDDDIAMLPRATSPTILAIGRLVPQKDFPLAVASFARLDDSYALRILGEGARERQIRDTAERHGVARRVTMGGYVAGVGEALSQARLLLLTSLYEGYPAVVVEALAAGVPVVATACSPAIHELLSDPELGIVVRDRSPEAIAAAMKTVLSRPMPPLEKCHEIAARHRMGPVARAYLDLFDKVWDARGKNGG